MNRVQTADEPGAEAGRQPRSLLVGEEAVADEPTKPHRLYWSVVVGVIQGILVLAVLAGGAYVAIRLVQTKPEAKRKPPQRRAKLVEVETVRATREPVKVHAMGTVGAARRVELQARVAGEIVWLSPDCIPGGRFAKDAEIAKIDRADYDLAVEQQTTETARLAAMVEKQEADVAQRQSEILQRASVVIQSEAALKIERGQQSVARREYELLGRSVKEEDRDLVLRVPQLRSAEATCKAAKAAKLAAEAMKRSAESATKAAVASQQAAAVALKKAELDRDRTTIKAPFSGIVESRTIEEGSQVTTAKPFATLVGTDCYWVEVSIPVDQLQWLRIPRKKGDPASAARIHDEAAWGKDAHRTGTVLRLASALEAEGRMARLLVAVPDPLALRKENAGKPALLLGSYVRVEIDGVDFDNVVAL
ncbi:HlyD family efflux transporter periplasmic adaptor subunit, partial [bacterium]|nr:HlyD family efflux transporter periplasmic adaptor subunit [bacterium]